MWGRKSPHQAHIGCRGASGYPEIRITYVLDHFPFSRKMKINQIQWGYLRDTCVIWGTLTSVHTKATNAHMLCFSPNAPLP